MEMYVKMCTSCTNKDIYIYIYSKSEIGVLYIVYISIAINTKNTINSSIENIFILYTTFIPKCYVQ